MPELSFVVIGEVLVRFHGKSIALKKDSIKIETPCGWRYNVEKDGGS